MASMITERLQIDVNDHGTTTDWRAFSWPSRLAGGAPSSRNQRSDRRESQAFICGIERPLPNPRQPSRQASPLAVTAKSATSPSNVKPASVTPTRPPWRPCSSSKAHVDLHSPSIFFTDAYTCGEAVRSSRRLVACRIGGVREADPRGEGSTPAVGSATDGQTKEPAPRRMEMTLP